MFLCCSLYGTKLLSEQFSLTHRLYVVYLGVREATAAYRMLLKVKEVKEQEEEKKSATKPRPYRHIKVRSR